MPPSRQREESGAVAAAMEEGLKLSYADQLINHNSSGWLGGCSSQHSVGDKKASSGILQHGNNKMPGSCLWELNRTGR